MGKPHASHNGLLLNRVDKYFDLISPSNHLSLILFSLQWESLSVLLDLKL